MNKWNPKGLRRNHRGELLDKWGRKMEVDWKEFEKKRLKPGDRLQYPKVLNPMHAAATPQRTAESIVDALLEQDASIETRLKSIARRIKHCGDYGVLYYHPQKHEVHWTAGDSDGPPEFTSPKEIEQMLSIGDIRHVEVGDEWSPDEDEGWQRLEFRHG